MKSELKACPFCGKTMLSTRNEYGDHSIKCLSCGCSFGPFPSLKISIEKWNTRAPSKDREFLIELLNSQLNIQLNMIIVFDKNELGNERAIALKDKIINHLDENP